MTLEQIKPDKTIPLYDNPTAASPEHRRIFTVLSLEPLRILSVSTPHFCGVDTERKCAWIEKEVTR